MKRVRLFTVMSIIAVGLTTPVQAQFYYKGSDVSGFPVLTLDPAFDQPMPGATPTEINATLVWNLRSALNFAALQCQFEPTTRTVENYNAIIKNHKTELEAAYKVINGYFTRTFKNPKVATGNFDKFLTRVISSYSSALGQKRFCEVAANAGRETLFTPRGQLLPLANTQLTMLRRSLAPAWEQKFPPATFMTMAPIRYPDFSSACWGKKGYGNCGFIYHEWVRH
jgi:hypothetical protein